MNLGSYLPGDSLVHRAPAGVKLVLLAVGLLALGVFRSPWTVTVAAVLTLAAGIATGLGARVLWAQIRPVLLVSAVVGAFQVWLSGPVQAAVVVGWLLVAVLAAGLVTVTTPLPRLLDAVVTAAGPLRRVGVDPERVALLLALAVRSVPVVAGLARDVQEARIARGEGRSVRAFAVPLVIRTVRYADRLGEALAARGVDDD
ncbi:MAG: biotin transport system permease protein [Actinomycetota bacterium]|nr:biotin transport system permease protein [Actinomycetota bacterium]